MQETEIRVLQKELSQLQKHIDEKTLAPNAQPELTKLYTENVKLKHRLTILNRAIANLSSKNSAPRKITTMENIQEILKNLFAQAISSTFPDLTDPPVVISLSGNNPKFGDYQCNSAMPVSNIYKQQGK